MTAFNKSLPKPRWLIDPPREGTTGIGYRYYNKIWDAQPPWPGLEVALRNIYKEAKSMRKEGYDVHVDHIYPLVHPLFCGLHVPANLQIIPGVDNMIKSNIFYPGFEQLDFFKPEFFELEMT